MITLFRRIRQKLIDSGSATKYLLYAIGEILLVMIGILLALQVNNWNEERKTNAEMVLYHQRLLEDVDLLLEDAEEAVSYANENFEAMLFSLSALQEGILPAEKDSVFQAFLDRYFKFTLNITDLNAYNEMQSAGKLGLISDLDLRSELSNLIDAKDFFTEVQRTFHRNSHLNSQYLDPYVEYRFMQNPADSLTTNEVILFDFDAMAQDKVLIRKVSRQTMLWRQSTVQHNRLIELIRHVKEKLNNETARLADR